MDLVDTTFPAGRNDALQWNIKSQMAGKIPVEIRYFTSGITWAADYVGIANEDETKLNVTGYVRVTNNSGELYDNAQTRLVVGKINLVEKIADLARRPPPGRPRPPASGPTAALRRRAGATGEGKAEPGLRRRGCMDGGCERRQEPRRPKAVVKQGLSEYFLFTIEGREDIKDKEPKRLVALKVADVPLECFYKLTDRDGGQRSPSSTASRTSSCWTRRARRRSSRPWRTWASRRCPTAWCGSSPSTRTRTWPTWAARETKYVPIGDRVEVNVGADKDITIHRRLKDQKIEQRRGPAVQAAAGRPVRALLRPGGLRRDVLLRGGDRLRQAGRGQDRGRAAVRRQRGALGPGRAAQGLGRPTSRGPTSICTTIAGRVERVDQKHVKYFLDLQPGKKQLVQLQRDLQAPQGGAGTEHGAEAGTAVSF